MQELGRQLTAATKVYRGLSGLGLPDAFWRANEFGVRGGISSIEIENIAVGHPRVELAAVIGAAHPKWDERPVLIVKLKPGEAQNKQEHLDFLQGKIAKWWMPDDVVFVDDIPLGATGKIDKKLLRERLKDYRLPTAAA